MQAKVESTMTNWKISDYWKPVDYTDYIIYLEEKNSDSDKYNSNKSTK